MIKYDFGKVDLEVMDQEENKNFVIIRQSASCYGSRTKVGKGELEPIFS